MMTIKCVLFDDMYLCIQLRIKSDFFYSDHSNTLNFDRETKL